MAVYSVMLAALIGVPLIEWLTTIQAYNVLFLAIGMLLSVPALAIVFLLFGVRIIKAITTPAEPPMMAYSVAV
jgi:ABC-type proline/glycine betaine transport system permease subunit